MRHAAPRSRRKPAVTLFVSVLLMGMGCGIAIASADESGKDAQTASVQRDQAVAELEEAKRVAEQAASICARGGAGAKILGSVCQQAKTVAEKPPVVVEKPAADGLTEARARQLVREEIASQDIKLSPAVVNQIARVAATFVPPGKPGTPGAPGKSFTVADAVAVVRAAVALECSNNRCDGPKGDTGGKGDTGDTGDIGPAGKDAPPVTEEQRRADLAAYCGQESQPCRGNLFPFVFRFALEGRNVTCTITAPSVVQQCETVIAEPSGDPPGGS